MAAVRAVEVKHELEIPRHLPPQEATLVSFAEGCRELYQASQWHMHRRYDPEYEPTNPAGTNTATDKKICLQIRKMTSRCYHLLIQSVPLMDNKSIKRVPENAPGDFYVESGCCLRCCLPHEQAPELMNDSTQEFQQCFFRRQPRTPEETEHAIQAIWVSETASLRYGGTDQAIIQKLHKRGVGHCCDHPLNPQKPE
jgi:hypothetical protein